MVPEEHEIVLPGTPELRAFFKTEEFETECRGKLQEQYEVVLTVRDDATPIEGEGTLTEERLVFSYTRNNAGGLKDAIDFLVGRLVPHGLDAATVKGTIPRPKSDSFEQNLPFFNSKLLQHTPKVDLVTDSPTRSTFGTDDSTDRLSLFDKLRKPGSISSISSFINSRKNHSSSSTSLFKHASSNASKASLISIESRDSGYRNPWNDSGVNLPGDDDLHIHSNGWPVRFDHSSKSSFNSITMPAGDMTPRHDSNKPSFDNGRPATSHSINGYPGPIGPPR